VVHPKTLELDSKSHITYLITILEKNNKKKTEGEREKE
jgi:hypothetical protein